MTRFLVAFVALVVAVPLTMRAVVDAGLSLFVADLAGGYVAMAVIAVVALVLPDRDPSPEDRQGPTF